MGFMRKAVVRVIIVFCVATVGIPAAQAGNVNFIESSINAFAGESFTVHLIGSGFTLGPDAATFSLSWDESVLGYVDASVANPPWDTSIIESASTDVGLLDFVILGKSLGNAGSDFEIASFTFKVLDNPGSDSSFLELADVYGGWASAGNNISVNYVNSQVQVVPLPAAVWLFGAGLTGMMGSMKRRKTS